MTGKRYVVVGASTGLGRCIGIEMVRRGDTVALLARRHELLVEAAAEGGPGAHAITCDVTDGGSVTSAIDQAVAALGGIDGIVYSTGIGWVGPIEDIDTETWQRVFTTNVIGANLVTAAALPHLKASGGVVAYLSSVSASYTAPWPGMAAYLVTKAALDKLVEAWRVEHPEVGFTRVVVGDCSGGEGIAASQFLSGMDMDQLKRFYPVWAAKGLLSGTVMGVEPLIDLVHAVLRAGADACVPSITVTPRLPPLQFDTAPEPQESP